ESFGVIRYSRSISVNSPGLAPEPKPLTGIASPVCKLNAHLTGAPAGIGEIVQAPRPIKPAITSFETGSYSRSYTGARGRPVPSTAQVVKKGPRAVNTPLSLPTITAPVGLLVLNATDRKTPGVSVNRFPVTLVQVAPA